MSIFCQLICLLFLSNYPVTINMTFFFYSSVPYIISPLEYKSWRAGTPSLLLALYLQGCTQCRAQKRCFINPCRNKRDVHSQCQVFVTVSGLCPHNSIRNVFSSPSSQAPINLCLDWMFVSSSSLSKKKKKIICWNPNPQCNGIRVWRLWETLRSFKFMPL